MSIRRRPASGFTLIELMIVIAIIAILAAILVPNFIRARAQGQVTACKCNLRNISTALEMYATDSGGRYPESGQLAAGLVPNFMSTIPTCASAGADTYSAAYEASLNPDSYTVVCGGSNHSGVGLAANFPQYNGTEGLVER